LAIKSLNLFGEFLDYFELKNTKEIFNAETNFKTSKDITNELRK
jgi:hypothetical protein